MTLHIPKPGDQVLATSELHGGEHIGNIQEVYDYGDAISVHVRLHLEDDHPAMREAVADSGMTADQVEIVESLPLAAVKKHDFGVNEEPYDEAATLAQLAAKRHAARFAQVRAEIKAGVRARLALRELDQGLRTKGGLR